MKVVHNLRICDNFAVGCFHASFERHFVKIIQHQLLSFHAVYYQFYFRCLVGVLRCKNIILN